MVRAWSEEEVLKLQRFVRKKSKRMKELSKSIEKRIAFMEVGQR